MPAISITGLSVYPIKSCRGIATARARVGVRGLALDADVQAVGDREWMVVDRDGQFVTQRDQPRLALVATALAGDSLRISAPGRESVDVALVPAGGPTREVVVWNSRVSAHDCGDALAAWFSGFLGLDVRIVRFDMAHERHCNPEYAGDSGAHTAFADAYPLLVAGEASLADLNVRLGATGSPALPMNRFRPNVTVSGLDSYDEDHLDTIETGGVVLKFVKPCTRCQITTTDQATAVRGTEPLHTLGGYRNDARLGGVTFGMNAIVVAGAGRELAVGMTANASFRF